MNGFLWILGELRRRTLKPVGQLVYWTVFGVSVVGLGGLGLWLELSKPLSSEGGGAFTALVTFFPALIGSCCLQMVFESKQRRLLAFAVLCAAGALIAANALFDAAPPTYWTWFFAILACLFALWIWWVANADNPNLQDDPPSDASLGGDPNAALDGTLDSYVA